MDIKMGLTNGDDVDHKFITKRASKICRGVEVKCIKCKLHTCYQYQEVFFCHTIVTVKINAVKIYTSLWVLLRDLNIRHYHKRNVTVSSITLQQSLGMLLPRELVCFSSMTN